MLYEVITEDAVIQDPQFIDAHLLLGKLFFQQDHNKKAIRSLNRVLELYPANEEAALLLAVALARNDRITSYNVCYTKLLRET